MRSILPTDQCQAMASARGHRAAGHRRSPALSIDSVPNTATTRATGRAVPTERKMTVRPAPGPLDASSVFWLLLLPLSTWLLLAPTAAHDGINQTDSSAHEGKLALFCHQLNL